MTYFSDWQTEAKSLSESGRADEALIPVQRLLPLDLTRYSAAGWKPEQNVRYLVSAEKYTHYL